MTAINVVVQREAAHIITDSAWYTEDGEVIGFGPKVHPFPHWPGAIAIRGPAIALALIGMKIGWAFGSIDEFAPQACAALHSILTGQDFRDVCRLERQAIDLFCIGWSDKRGGPMAFMVTSSDDIEDGEDIDRSGWEGEILDRSAANQLLEISTALMIPSPSAHELKEYNITHDVDLNAVEPSDLGQRILLAQRSFKASLTDGGPPVHCIGGYSLITTVSRDYVFTIRGIGWKDKVGELIKPAPFDTVLSPRAQRESEAAPAGSTPPAAGMTRQQRRAWEAQQRKRPHLRPVT